MGYLLGSRGGAEVDLAMPALGLATAEIHIGHGANVINPSMPASWSGRGSDYYGSPHNAKTSLPFYANAWSSIELRGSGAQAGQRGRGAEPPRPHMRCSGGPPGRPRMS